MVGRITGVTQNKSDSNLVVFTAPELTQMVNKLQNGYSVSSVLGPWEHYHLSGNMVHQLAKNASKIKDCLEHCCEEIPFISGLKLVNITFKMALLDSAKDVRKESAGLCDR